MLKVLARYPDRTVAAFGDLRAAVVLDRWGGWFVSLMALVSLGCVLAMPETEDRDLDTGPPRTDGSRTRGRRAPHRQ